MALCALWTCSVETGRRRPLRHGHLDPRGEGVRRHDGEDGLGSYSVRHEISRFKAKSRVAVTMFPVCIVGCLADGQTETGSSAHTMNLRICKSGSHGVNFYLELSSNPQLFLSTFETTKPKMKSH